MYQQAYVEKWGELSGKLSFMSYLFSFFSLLNTYVSYKLVIRQ